MSFFMALQDSETSGHGDLELASISRAWHVYLEQGAYISSRLLMNAKKLKDVVKKTIAECGPVFMMEV